MATTKVVNGKVTGADGSIRPYGTVLIRLSTPTVIVGQQEITLGPISVAASTVDGTWSVSLYSNSDLSPANTYYTVTEVTDIATSSYQISVPGTAGPFQASSIVTLPSVSGLPAGHVSTLVVDSTATFNGAVAVNAAATFAGAATFQGGQASGGIGVNLALSSVAAVTAETIGFQQAAQALTVTANYATERFALFAQPTITAPASQTITNAATVAIANAPAAAGSAVITNALALWVQAGSTRFDGGVSLTALGSRPIGNLLDLRATSASIGGVASPGTDQIGDKLALYGNSLGLGVQGSALVLYTGAGQRVSFRASSGSGNASSGTEAFLFWVGGSTVSAERALFDVVGQTATITGGYTTQRFALFEQPTISGAFTVTNAATVAIANAPAAAGGATLTNPYALWVQAGVSRFDGGVAPGAFGTGQTANALWMGTGVPSNSNGANGDFYFRTDTPGTANQRLYIRAAGAWTALTL